MIFSFLQQIGVNLEKVETFVPITKDFLPFQKYPS